MSPPFARGGPMPADLVLDLPATTSGLHECLDRIEQSCAGWNLRGGRGGGWGMVVEELYSNTIKYGYGGETGRPVRLRLTSHPAIALVYEDEAPPFDPTAWQPAGSAARPGIVGQTGIALI